MATEHEELKDRPGGARRRLLMLTKYDVLQYGIAAVLDGLTAELPALGYDVVVYSSDLSAQAGRLHDGTPCRHGPLPDPGSWLPMRKMRALVDYCREQRVELVQTLGVYRPGLAATLLRRHLGIPYVATSHGDLVASGEPRMRRRNVQRRLQRIFEDAAALTHLNGYMLEQANAVCDVSARSCIIPNGIDLATWQSPVVPLGGGYVLGIGRLVRVKGFHVLVDAAGMLKQRGRPVRLVVAGEGEEAGELREQARRLGLTVVDDVEHLADAPPDAVCFPGMAAGELKRRLFYGASIVAFPTQPEMPESFGIVQVEAMAAGKAVIASDLPVPRQLFQPGHNGDLVDPRRAGDWADAIDGLLADAPRRRRYESLGLEAAKNYGWPVVARQYARVYDQVLRQNCGTCGKV